MAILLWSLLNLVLLLAFFYLGFRAIKLLKQHVHPAAALLFGAGLLLLASGKADSQAGGTPAQNLLSGASAGGPIGNASSSQTIPLGFNTLHLLAEYHSADGLIRPRGLYTTVSGVVLGHRWEPLTGQVQPQGQQLRYQIVLRHSWYLLGAPVFSSTDDYAGILPPDQTE